MAGDGYVDMSCSDLVAMRRWSLEHWLSNLDSVLEARERLERGELSVAQLQEAIKCPGFCVTKEGPLTDQKLRAAASRIDVFEYDFMYSAFQDGLMPNATYLIVEATLRLAHGRSHRWSTFGVFSGHRAIQSATL